MRTRISLLTLEKFLKIKILDSNLSPKIIENRLVILGDNNDDWENEAELHMIDMCPIFTAPESWYKDLIHYLQQGYLPEYWNSKQRRALRLNSTSYKIIDGFLFRKNYDGVFMRFLEQEDASKVVKELHDGPTGGHFFRRHYCRQDSKG